MAKTATATKAKPSAKSAAKPAAKAAPAVKAAGRAKSAPSSTPPVIIGGALTGETTTGTTSSGAPKNFRNHPDIENFFRFIYENDLREEGLEILNTVLIKKAEKRAAKKAGLN